MLVKTQLRMEKAAIVFKSDYILDQEVPRLSKNTAQTGCSNMVGSVEELRSDDGDDSEDEMARKAAAVSSEVHPQFVRAMALLHDASLPPRSFGAGFPVGSYWS
jgi:hypothetical protein